MSMVYKCPVCQRERFGDELLCSRCAVREEREACAKIADALAKGKGLDPYCCVPLAEDIAAKIRERGKE